MITPLNGHVLIAPIKHDDFVEGGSSFDEMGEVLELEPGYIYTHINKGDIVYFDSFLCKKYPGEDADHPIWLVDYKDIVGKK